MLVRTRLPKLAKAEVKAQGLVTIHVNILSMYKHICLHIDSIFTWIVTRPCGQRLHWPWHCTTQKNVFNTV